MQTHQNIPHALSAAPQLRMVIFATSVDMAPELLHVGAIGYVAKDDSVEYLITAIRAAKAGQRAVSPIVQRYRDQNTGKRKRFRLTPREHMVLKLFAQGVRTPEVAAQLHIALGTAQNYVTAMLRKTGCKDRTQLVIQIAQAKTGATFALAFGGMATLLTDDAATIATLTSVGESYGTLIQYGDDLRDAAQQPAHAATLPAVLRRLPHFADLHQQRLHAFWSYVLTTSVAAVQERLAEHPARMQTHINALFAQVFELLPGTPQ